MFLRLVGLGLSISLASCGYALRTSKSEMLQKEGIRRVYIKPVENNTYKAGADTLVYNALVKTIASHRRVKLVRHELDADAVLRGVVSQADYHNSALTSADQIPVPAGAEKGPSTVVVATKYNAVLTCSFSLSKKKKRRRKGHVWTSTFNRSKTFAGNNQLGVLGASSALINDSEFDRALGDLANEMMEDVHEAMLAMF